MLATFPNTFLLLSFPQLSTLSPTWNFRLLLELGQEFLQSSISVDLKVSFVNGRYYPSSYFLPILIDLERLRCHCQSHRFGNVKMIIQSNLDALVPIIHWHGSMELWNRCLRHKNMWFWLIISMELRSIFSLLLFSSLWDVIETFVPVTPPRLVCKAVTSCLEGLRLDLIKLWCCITSMTLNGMESWV